MNQNIFSKDSNDKLPHPFDQQLKEKNLVILLVSDIHMATKKLEKLKLWYAKNCKQRIHYVFALGDFDNLDNLNPKKEDSINQLENISNVLTFLEFVSAPIIYIPGNHDTPELFSKEQKLTQHSTNIHSNKVSIASDLQVVGFGGSIPAYKRTAEKVEQVWDGYPYSNDNNFGIDLRGVLDAQCADPKMQTILLTHNGPDHLSVSEDRVEFDFTVHLGSDNLYQVLYENKYNLLCNLHGHSHAGTGRCNIKKLQVINPGSLSWSEFGILKLARNSLDDKWIVESTEFYNLDAY